MYGLSEEIRFEQDGLLSVQDSNGTLLGPVTTFGKLPVPRGLRNTGHKKIRTTPLQIPEEVHIRQPP